MAVRYSWSNEFTAEGLERLFLSVEWESGRYPDKLRKAMLNSHKVHSVWDGNELIGLINSMTDTVLTVYFQYLLVHPDYQGHGLGKQLVRGMMEKYEDIPRKVLISIDRQVGFYESCGFSHHTDKAPMFISNL